MELPVAQAAGAQNVAAPHPAWEDAGTRTFGGEEQVEGTGGDLLSLPAGKVAGLLGSPGLGLTRLGLHLLAGHAGAPVACVDVRGWLCPAAAWEVGIPGEHLVVARCSDPVQWGVAVATLVEGVRAVYAEVPRGVRDDRLRRLAALARTRQTALVLRPLHGSLPAGILHVRFEAHEVRWDGTDSGHGRLTRRRIVLEVSGKAVRGIARRVEMEDDGTDAVRLVSRLAPAPVGYAAG